MEIIHANEKLKQKKNQLNEMEKQDKQKNICKQQME